jgi:hypothetical protein
MASVTSFSPRAIAGSHARRCAGVPSAATPSPPAIAAKMPSGAAARPALLEQEPEVDQRSALPAVLRRQREAEPTEAGDRLPERWIVSLGGAVPGEPAIAIDLGREETTRLLLDGLLLFARCEVHAYFRGSPSPRCAMMARWISFVPPPNRCIGAVV